MVIDAKINLQINGISSFWSKRYKVYLNDNFVGNLDYKNAKIGVWSKVGTQKLTVKRKDFEKELEVILTAEKHIITVNIDENAFAAACYSKFRYSQMLKRTVQGLTFLYLLFVIYSIIYERIENNFSLIIWFIILSSLAFSKPKNKLPFDLRIKNA
jgi:hypothetical protein